MFCDQLKLKLVAGIGGDGCSSFRREKFVPKGGPDGGDGGDGGNIVFKVNPQLNTLSHLANKKTYTAPKGENGRGKKMYGKTGEDLILEVPPGTIIFTLDKKTIIADLSIEKNEFTIVRGGIGGKGNARFKSSTNQAPRFAEQGEPGEKKEILLELKLVADVGLIGLPSAGKSTVISVISNARPKIAAYHFTTLVPNLGVVKITETNTFVVADIPGLIEGASQGKGLGHKFLKHVARTKLLVHIIDASLEETEKNYKTIIKELKTFDKTLAKREEIIVLNKIDLLSEDQLKEKLKIIKKIAKKKPYFSISAISHTGLKPLLFEISNKLEEIKKAEAIKPREKKEIPILRPHLEQIKFEIAKITGKKGAKTFHIIGKRIEQVAIMTDTKGREGLERMYHFIEKMGIKAAVDREKASFGDCYKINDKKIPYRK